MIDLVDRIGVVWLSGSLGALVLFGVVAVAMVMSGQPARRCMMARGAILGSLLILPLSVYSPLSSIRLSVPISQLVAARGGSTAPGDSDWDRESLKAWRVGLTMAAMTGTAISLGFVLLGWAGSLRYIQKTVEPDPETLAIYESLPSPSRRKRPRLRVSARVRSPVVVGFLRPIILIPPDLDEPSEAKSLRLSLLHELVHVERRDTFFGFASSLAGALWFFLPPLWWLRSQMRLDQEFLADHVASARFGARLAYASSLVGLAQAQPTLGDEDESPTSGANLGGAALLLRVLMLIRCPFPVETSPPRWWKRFACLAIGTLTISVASLSLQGITVPLFGGVSQKSRATGARHGVLQMSRLIFDAPIPGPDGRPRPFMLLTRLPQRFELVLDVWGSSSDFRMTAILGRYLWSRPGNDAGPTLPEGFHRVRLVRSHRGLSVWVAGKLIPARSEDLPIPEFLTFQPAPGQPGRYRNLLLSW